MVEIYITKSFRNNFTKKKNHEVITINEKFKHMQKWIKFEKIEKFQLARKILKTKRHKLKILRSVQ